MGTTGTATMVGGGKEEERARGGGGMGSLGGWVRSPLGQQHTGKMKSCCVETACLDQVRLDLIELYMMLS